MSETVGVAGLPAAQFISDVAQYLEGSTINNKLTELQSLLEQYKFLESQLIDKRLRLKRKQPEIEKALQVVEMLLLKQEAEEEVKVDFTLAENVLACAKFKQVKSVNIWLGANVMLEYPLQDAQELLTEQLKNCSNQLEANQEQMYQAKENITTLEVSIARVYNHEILERKKQRESKPQ